MANQKYKSIEEAVQAAYPNHNHVAKAVLADVERHETAEAILDGRSSLPSLESALDWMERQGADLHPRETAAGPSGARITRGKVG
jgi:hypothetical protein